MPELINREFLDLAEERSFPLDESATGLSDQGTTLPNSILADARLTLDPSLGQSVFVASVVVSDELINLTLVVTDEVQFKPTALAQETYGNNEYEDPNNSPYFNSDQDEDFLSNTSPTFAGTGTSSPIIPLAVVTASLKDAVKGLPIRVEPLTDGVGGWVVFGKELRQHIGGTWTFSSVSQSSVSRRSIHFLNFSRVKTIKKAGEQSAVQGAVTIDGENGIAITQNSGTNLLVKGDGVEETISRDTLSVGFSGDLLKANLEKYIGPCGGRPDAASCYRGEPILSINGVKPVPPTESVYDNALFLIFPEELNPYVFAWGHLADTVGNSVINLTQNTTGLVGNTAITNTYESVTDIEYDSSFVGGALKLYATASFVVKSTVDSANLNGTSFTITDSGDVETTFTYDTSSTDTGTTIGLSGLTSAQAIADKIADSIDTYVGIDISATTDQDVGILVASEDISISKVCPSPFPEVDDSGNIGTESCCNEGSDYDDDCEEDCTDGVGTAQTVRSLYEEIDRSSKHVHICLGTDTMVAHEYNRDLDGVSRTFLTFAGSLKGEYIYAQSPADLESNLVIYVSAQTGALRVIENNVKLGIKGGMRTDACRSGDIVYVDETNYVIDLTVANKSVFGSVASALHTPVVDLVYAGGGSSTIADPAGYYCEKEYGVYTGPANYRLEVTPYADPLNIGTNMYPFTLYYTDSTRGIKAELVSDHFEITSVAEDNSSENPKPAPRLDSGTVSFTYEGDTYTGTIYSDLESLGGC
jgi:hypothetical protein